MAVEQLTDLAPIFPLTQDQFSIKRRNPMPEEDKYLKEKQVAEITAIALQTLRNDRYFRKGIPFIKKGRSVRYSAEDVHRFMQGHRVEMEG